MNMTISRCYCACFIPLLTLASWIFPTAVVEERREAGGLITITITIRDRQTDRQSYTHKAREMPVQKIYSLSGHEWVLMNDTERGRERDRDRDRDRARQTDRQTDRQSASQPETERETGF